MMNIARSLSTCFLTLLLAFLTQTAWAGQTTSSEGSAVTRDGQHDFDFSIGSWKTQVRRLIKPLSGSTEWVEGTGTVSTRKVWNGRADLEELTMDTPAGRLEGLALRLINEVVPPAMLEERALALAQELLSIPFPALLYTKRQIDSAFGQDTAMPLNAMTAVYEDCLRSPEHATVKTDLLAREKKT